MSFNYYVRDPAGTSIPVSLKMKQDYWLSTPRSLTFVADLWPATSVIMSLLVLPFSSDRRSYQSVLGAYIHVYLSLSCNENTWCFTILQGEQKKKNKTKNRKTSDYNRGELWKFYHLPARARSKFLSLSILSVMLTGFYKTSVALLPPD